MACQAFEKLITSVMGIIFSVLLVKPRLRDGPYSRLPWEPVEGPWPRLLYSCICLPLCQSRCGS